MKKFVVLSFLGIALSAFALFEVNVFDFHHLFERCEGSDHCRICTNCARCAYCKGSGTCGVCYTPRAVVRRSAPSRRNRSESSVSSNPVHSFDSRTPSLKRYYLRKSSARKYSSTKVSTNLDQPEPESFSTEEEKESSVKSSSLLTNKKELAENSQSIYDTPTIPAEKESFTLDIPENADFVRITASSAHLREQSNTKSSILQTLNHGDLLIKLKSVKGWVKVQALDSGEIGYVFGGLLK
ncbi:SH3 domain-containing protein [Dyadobacter sp. 3J3]|uniref:SH3 domain-containing protein n=1 Tax=Dyadobacter sp. 3J3 TaxID=2606600 RepID=UPI001359D869|nr:SH3 domain-containing protein [Dyadobacter sp. 3J3]